MTDTTITPITQHGPRLSTWTVLLKVDGQTTRLCRGLNIAAALDVCDRLSEALTDALGTTFSVDIEVDR